MSEPRTYPLGQGDDTPNTAWVQAAIDQAVAELRADMAERMFRLSEHVTWQMREVDAIVEILRAEHRRRTGADAPGFATTSSERP